MTVTKTILKNTVNRSTIKVVGTSAADTATIALKATITLAATGNITFTAGAGGAGTLTRAVGSWFTDLSAAGTSPAITYAADTVLTNDFIYVDATGLTIAAVAAKNKRIYTVAEIVSATVIRVFEDVAATATSSAGTLTAYRSDVGSWGQPVSGTPSVSVADASWSTAADATSSVTVVRDSTTILFLQGSSNIHQGYADYTKSAKDIVVTFNGSGGTIILELGKLGGFGQSDGGADVNT